VKKSEKKKHKGRIINYKFATVRKYSI